MININFVLPLLAFTVTALASPVIADDNTSTDETLVYRILHYNPNKPVAIIFGVLYLITGVALFIRRRSNRDPWGLCLPIGAICMAIGYFVRFADTFPSTVNSLGIYIIQSFFILCAPATFLAFNYIFYGRIIVTCIGGQYSIVRPERVARLFVISDITTFLIQGNGGGLTASHNNLLAKIGNYTVLVGLILQFASYAFFCYIALVAHYRVSSVSPERRHEKWWTAVWLLYFSSVFIIIRSIYRIAEYALGTNGYLVRHEVYFYCLDGLPLLIAIAVYVPFWPGRYIVGTGEIYKMSSGSGPSV